jgi:hypothetical protein
VLLLLTVDLSISSFGHIDFCHFSLAGRFTYYPHKDGLFYNAGRQTTSIKPIDYFGNFGFGEVAGYHALAGRYFFSLDRFFPIAEVIILIFVLFDSSIFKVTSSSLKSTTVPIIPPIVRTRSFFSSD